MCGSNLVLCTPQPRVTYSLNVSSRDNFYWTTNSLEQRVEVHVRNVYTTTFHHHIKHTVQLENYVFSIWCVRFYHLLIAFHWLQYSSYNLE